MWRSIIGAVAGQSGSPVAAFVVMGLSCALPPNVVDFFEGLGAQVCRRAVIGHINRPL
jgi:hypothetical protein